MSGGGENVMETADISVVKASKTHIIDVDIDQNVKSRLRRIDFYNIVEGDKRYILVSGSVTKEMGGASIDRKKVNIRFLDDKGNLLEEKTDRISISRMRRPTGYKGRFSIKVPYHSDIKRCLILFESKPR